MKNLVFIMFLFGASMVNAQLVVEEAAKDTVVWQASKLYTVPKIVRFTTEEEHSFTIYYKNAKYTQITDIDYLTLGDLETTKQFFQLCNTVLTDGKEFNVTIGSESVMIKKSSIYVMIWRSGSFFYLSKKNVESILEKLDE